MYLNNLNLNSFRSGAKAAICKKAGLAGMIGSGLDWLAPETTKNFIRPAWQGVNKELSNPNWSLDSLGNAAGKGIEANRVSNIENKYSPYGLTFNKDQYGAIDSNKPLDVMGSIKNLGGSAIDWAKNNPGKLLGGTAAIGGIGYLLSSLFKSAPKQQQNYQPQYPQPQYYQPSYQPEQVENSVSALDKYKFGEANPLDMRKYLTMQGALPLTYNFAKRLPTFGRSVPVNNQASVDQTPEVQDINVSAEDKALKKLLQKQEMREYIINLMQPKIV